MDLISSMLISGMVRSDLGWKHMTRQVPLAGSNLNSSSFVWLASFLSGMSGNRAGKSFPNTKVESYCGLVSPLGLFTLGHNGLFGSKGGISSSWVDSTWPLQGLFRRWGDTKIHSPLRGLYLMCWCSAPVNPKPNWIQMAHYRKHAD